MGRVQVRQIIAQQIQQANIANVGTVFAARPVILQEQAYTDHMNGLAYQVTSQSNENGSGCVIVVNMPDDQRSRVALTGLGAVDDFNKHQLALELWFVNVSGDGLIAQLDYDAIVDALFILIRNNQKPGPSGIIWMSGGEVGTGVDHRMLQPYTDPDGLTIFINGSMRYQAWEQLVGTGI